VTLASCWILLIAAAHASAMHYAGNPGPSMFNDIFGFFIWQAAGGTHTNLALLPNTVTPVSINSVNVLNNSNYYVSNDFGSSTNNAELNGFTTVLKTADYQVTAGTSYRVLLAIADGSDDGIDSVVWVKAGSVRFNIKDCTGSFVPLGAHPCSGTCEGGNGWLHEIFLVTQIAMNGGVDCTIANATTRNNITACINSDPCPVDCTGAWVSGGSCSGALSHACNGVLHKAIMAVDWRCIIIPFATACFNIH
jgi:hypothetical protein